MKYFITVFLMLFIFSCSNNSSPTKPTLDSQDITGRIYVYPSTDHVQIALRGEIPDTEYTTNPDSYGEFIFEDIPPGEYTLTASKDNCIFSPEEIPVTVAYEHIEVSEWFGLDTTYTDNDESVLFVSIEPDKGHLHNFKLTFNDLPDLYTTDQYGLGIITVKTGETLDITPHRSGYEYEYSPPSATITADKKLIVQHFTARYIGSPLHTVSGQLHYSDGIPYSNWHITLRNEHTSLWMLLDEDGSFSFTDLVDGTYTIKNNDDRFIFEPESIEVTVNGKDVIIDEQFVFVEYTGPTFYTLHGKVVDKKGICVPDVILSGIHAFYIEEEGIFIDDWITARHQDREYTVTPEKEGCIFEPPSYTFTAYYQEGVWHGGIIEIPDFVVTDYTIYQPDGYFPCGTGTSWTYDRRDTESGDDEYTMTIDGTENAGGIAYSRFAPEGPGGMRLLRADGGDVRAWDGDEDIVLIRFGVLPGTEWASGKDSAGYDRTGIFHGIEDVTVSAGTFAECLHYESRLNYGKTTYEAHEMWFAEDVGLVRQIRTLVNYGDEIERTEMELASYSER